ncbi:(deoxy)nucleoside triphosphate pyrophosphohydrolase [Vibrio europaeus]|uniref:8-oxo-dGTP diphosphatase n=1 Tax=Vibrio europaeus TaxID=300876 RepID=A0ABT5GTZ0_9VIBR|nr:(deoxy)nucleoside triphosphate pyrophosphohydrolase [Vibrio europaeus]MDC5703456.1 (deoxy)nucleoside triphosphate pyrophosphohydrolase [Vibrio europaeus]MDC5711389.1 (deoxy)nucleoside triphosphate pyrophosphohydrolase [Vibrio europaeus]MDC5714882.1 (deoxy)nucleoside triphosphate pyrophosphohydrolase [Vibrio europaeus]MDC5727500.1 (deoxy)nucleoside triphosphate pyrophosphohydrolase [Vibrio europaeus]MDC5729723.1 (deoxy)nucleoside triphosphate pyrophosphohydrolase [Vibrio europaeus]
MKKHIEVVAAVLKCQGLFLAVQRAESSLPYTSKKWEFPGGKVEQGESLDNAIKRELIEELDIVIDKPQFFITVEHSYPDFDITMHCFICELESDHIELKEHIDQRWLIRDDLMSVDWAQADIPAVQKLMSSAI